MPNINIDEIVKLIIDKLLPKEQVSIRFYTSWIILSIACITALYYFPSPWIAFLWIFPVLGLIQIITVTGEFLNEKYQITPGKRSQKKEFEATVEYIQDYYNNADVTRKKILKAIKIDGCYLLIAPQDKKLILPLEARTLVEVYTDEIMNRPVCKPTELGKKVLARVQLD